MSTDKSIASSFWVMILLQTIGSVDPIPGSGPRKMPTPGAFIPVILAWGILQLVADAGMERGAKVAGWIMVLTGAVIGPFGQRVVNLFSTVTTLYGGVASSGGSTATGASTTATPQPRFASQPKGATRPRFVQA